MPKNESDKVSEKYVFFYLRTGGGHLPPAKAVAEKIRSKVKGNVDIILMDRFTGSGYSTFSNNIRGASIINGVEPVSDYILNLN